MIVVILRIECVATAQPIPPGESDKPPQCQDTERGQQGLNNVGKLCALGLASREAVNGDSGNEDAVQGDVQKEEEVGLHSVEIHYDPEPETVMVVYRVMSTGGRTMIDSVSKRRRRGTPAASPETDTVEIASRTRLGDCLLISLHHLFRKRYWLPMPTLDMVAPQQGPDPVDLQQHEEDDDDPATSQGSGGPVQTSIARPDHNVADCPKVSMIKIWCSLKTPLFTSQLVKDNPGREDGKPQQQPGNSRKKFVLETRCLSSPQVAHGSGGDGGYADCSFRK